MDGGELLKDTITKGFQMDMLHDISTDVVSSRYDFQRQQQMTL